MSAANESAKRGDFVAQSEPTKPAETLLTPAQVSVARDAALLELGLALPLGPNAALNLSYGGQFGQGNRDQAAQVQARWAF